MTDGLASSVSPLFAEVVEGVRGPVSVSAFLSERRQRDRPMFEVSRIGQATLDRHRLDLRDQADARLAAVLPSTSYTALIPSPEYDTFRRLTSHTKASKAKKTNKTGTHTQGLGRSGHAVDTERGGGRARRRATGTETGKDRELGRASRRHSLSQRE
ncbi:hypothetical protein KIPB_002318 [Kipferlia bialata]|uniref:Uncharacterized protein n=1 Tax=Kipferlia bialata TaxID=797122 RepID=A0A9K3CSJ1_9EUKA|nr:hypothetical protein KIPB_002318 [Kipferlia bialata]|eukprot:g2318.t1